MTAFPPEPPVDLDDPEVIRAHDWRAFESLERTDDHWARPDWTPATRAYYWMLTFVDRDLLQLAKRCQGRIASPAFDLVPLDALHVTVGRIGFAGELTSEVVAEVATVAKRMCADVTPFALEIGPLAGSRGALRFSVSPWAPLMAMHRRLAEATARVLGSRAVMDTRRFRPHLSIAYANTTVRIASLRPVLHELRELPPVSVRLPAVSLVELWREGRAYRFAEVRRIGFER